MSAFSFHDLVLFAAPRQYLAMGQRFPRSGSNLQWHELLLFGAALALLCLAVWGVTQALAWRERWRKNNPGLLFRELCAAHGLCSAERGLLIQLAQHHDCAPDLLFVQPACFETPHLPAALKPRQGDLLALAQRLFTDCSANG